MPQDYMPNEVELQITKDIIVALVQEKVLIEAQQVTVALREIFPVVRDLMQSR